MFLLVGLLLGAAPPQTLVVEVAEKPCKLSRGMASLPQAGDSLPLALAHCPKLLSFIAMSPPDSTLPPSAVSASRQAGA